MTDSHDAASAVAEALLQARRTHQPCDPQPLAASLTSAEQAYSAQDLVFQTLHGTRRSFPRYWKSGGPSRQSVLTHAPLPPDGVWSSPAQAGDWPFQMRLIEAEIALRLGSEVTALQAGGLAEGQGAALVDAMTVSIEVVDSRWQQPLGAPALLKLADLQSHGALVLGEWVAFTSRDWSSQQCLVKIGAGAAVERRGTHTLGDPTWLLPAWLRHATRDGAAVPAGTVVTTGTWCGMLPAAPGDLVSVRFDGVGEARVQL